MKKSRVLLAALALVLICAAARAEGDYVSIKQIRDGIPARWIGVYTDREGSAVSIDAPIVVPQVEAVPVVRITWGGPYTQLDAGILTDENDANHLIAEFSTDANEVVSMERAPEVYVQRLKEKIPQLEGRALENYMLLEETGEPYGKRYRMAFYSSFHGIPYLIGNNFRLEVPSEKPGDLPAVPANVTQGCLLADAVGVTLCAPREVCVEVEDIPLLPFERILPVFEQWVADGYAYSLDEMRFGYMAFIDPEQLGKEFVLLPVWVAKGVTRGEPGMPFVFDEDPESLVFMGYMNPTVCAVNAQTGERYAFVDDTRKDRRYVPDVITWDERMP